MTNNESFAHIDDAIRQTNTELDAYDALAERIPTQQETIAALNDDMASIHRNDGGAGRTFPRRSAFIVTDK